MAEWRLTQGGDEMASNSALQVQVSICMASVDQIVFYLADPDQSRAEFYNHSRKKEENRKKTGYFLKSRHSLERIFM